MNLEELRTQIDGIDEKMLELYKKVCRRYLYSYPSCIKSYIAAYRAMLKDENE